MKHILFLNILIFTSIIALSQGSFKELSEKAGEEMSNKNYKKALELFDAAFKIDGVDDSELTWTASIAALCAQEAKDLRKAMKYNSIAIEHNTTDVLIYESQIELAKRLKDNKTMEDVLLVGRKKLEGQYQRFTTKLLYFYYNNKMYEKLFVIADEVLAYKPDHLKTYYFKGIAYLNTGNEEEAITAFKKMLSIDSEDADANMRLGLLYFNKASAIHDKSKSYYNSLKKPSREDYSNYRKEIEQANISYKKAIPYLENRYKVKPDAKIKDALFLLYTRLGQNENADKYKKQ